MNKSILVLGATGHVGRPLVAELIAKGETVKAASRSGRSFANAEGVVFDFQNPETFSAAFNHVDRVYVMLPAGYVQSKELLTPIIEFAASRQIKVVLQTAFGVNADDAIPYRQVELTLEKSGTPYVILRPNWFADNFHTFWKAGIEQGQITVPAAEGRSSFIDVRDIAAAAAEALTNDHFDGKDFDLTGPEALSYAEAAQVLTQVTGKSISYTSITDDNFISMLKTAGITEDYAAFVTSLFYPVREGWTAAVTNDVEILTGRKARALREYAETHLTDLTVN